MLVLSIGCRSGHRLADSNSHSQWADCCEQTNSSHFKHNFKSQTQGIEVFIIDSCFVAATDELGEKFGGVKIWQRCANFFLAALTWRTFGSSGIQRRRSLATAHLPSRLQDPINNIYQSSWFALRSGFSETLFGHYSSFAPEYFLEKAILLPTYSSQPM